MIDAVEQSTMHTEDRLEAALAHAKASFPSPVFIANPDERCPICLRKANLVYDHDHATGEFRGWICSFCNTGLGYFRDSIFALGRAADYLMQHDASQEAKVKRAVLHPETLAPPPNPALEYARKHGLSVGRIRTVRRAVARFPRE